MSQPTFKNFSIIDENLVQTNHFLPTIKHNIPIAIGVTILDISKFIMFDAWYNRITNLKNCKFELAFTDTDSFAVKVSDSQAFWKHVNDIMDYSNYDPTHPQYDTSCKAKFGYFKDELAGKTVCTEFVGLRAKCYSMLLKDCETNKNSEKKKCKGIKRLTVQKKMKFDDYKSCLFQKKTYRQKFNLIRSSNHTIKTIRLQKKALNYLDTKRYILKCGLHSLPYGSYLIQKYGDKCQQCLNRN